MESIKKKKELQNKKKNPKLISKTNPPEEHTEIVNNDDDDDNEDDEEEKEEKKKKKETKELETIKETVNFIRGNKNYDDSSENLKYIKQTSENNNETNNENNNKKIKIKIFENNSLYNDEKTENEKGKEKEKQDKDINIKENIDEKNKVQNIIKEDNNKDKNTETVPSTNNIIKMAFIYAKSKTESKLLQLEYKRGNEEIRNKIFKAIEFDVLTLSKDSFGNYVIQTILIYGDEKILEKIFEKIENNIFELSYDKYGCRVLQTLIEIFGKSNRSKIEIILKKLEGNLRSLFSNRNGNHVIQKIIYYLDFEKLIVIYNKIYDYIKIITHQYGSRIVQAILGKCDKEKAQKLIDRIFEEYKNILILCKDEYSNYILQYILENYPNNIEYFINHIKNNVYNLSQEKASSNIIEKILEYGDDKQRDLIGKEIIEKDNDEKEEKSLINKLSNHQYGNYVVQKMIEYCSEPVKKELIKRVNNISPKDRSKYWYYIENIIEKNK